MTQFPSFAPTADLAAAFPTVIPDVEQLVYEYVVAASAYGLETGVPALSFYSDRERSAREGRTIDVVRGWPAYPGVVPAIGVAAGPEGEDQQHELPGGGFVGDVYAHGWHFPEDGSGIALPDEGGLATEIVGSATYFAEPLASTVMVELIHENRDERDRLHNELRRVLFPMRRWMPMRDHQVRKVAIDAEKSDQTIGPPESEQPFDMYVSLFTVHVLYEMLEATDVRGQDSVVGRIDVTVSSSDSGP